MVFKCLGHIHGFLWLENALPVEDLNWDNPINLSQITEYFSGIITAYNPDPFQSRGTVDCLLKDMLPPAAHDQWDLEADHCALCNQYQKHGRIQCGIC